LRVRAIFDSLCAVSFELQYETVLVAQPADVELIFEGLVIVFRSQPLCDFHWKIVMDAKRPYGQFARFPVLLTFTERTCRIVVSIYRPCTSTAGS